MEIPSTIAMQYTNPIGLLEQWRKADDSTKVLLREQYLTHWLSTEYYIPDLFNNVGHKTKETHWHYWWKTIGLIKDHSLRCVWLDKWFNALAEARLRREIRIETELLENTKYWVWSDDREEFFCELTTLLIQDFVNTRTYNSDIDPFYVHIQYPGVGSASETWRSMVYDLINKTYPNPYTKLGQFNQAKLWVLTSSRAYKGSEELALLQTPDVIWVKDHPYIWDAIIKDKLSIRAAWDRMDDIERNSFKATIATT